MKVGKCVVFDEVPGREFTALVIDGLDGFLDGGTVVVDGKSYKRQAMMDVPRNVVAIPGAHDLTGLEVKVI